MLLRNDGNEDGIFLGLVIKVPKDDIFSVSDTGILEYLKGKFKLLLLKR